MSDIKTAIVDAAERRIRLGGFGGFSFREIAADVGIKSSSVHYHFPTKDDLASAVVRRWTECVKNAAESELEKTPDPVHAWTNVFRAAAQSSSHMCPCTALGVSSQDLPDQVAADVRAFWSMCQDKMIEDGLDPEEATRLLATVTGGVVLASAFGDARAFDRATSEFSRKARASAPA